MKTLKSELEEKKTFKDQVKEMPDDQLLTVYREVSGLFYWHERIKSPNARQTYEDMITVDMELRNRLNSRVARKFAIFGGKG